MSIKQQRNERINEISLINSTDGSHVNYTGPFPVHRDGPYVEVTIPIDESPGVLERTAEKLVEAPHDIAALVTGAEIEVTGKIETSDIIEGSVLFRIRDGDYVELAELDNEQIPEGIDR